MQDHQDAFHEWAKIYGDVMPLKVLGKSLVVLSSEAAAIDLLEKRGAKYSDRPSIPMMELLEWDKLLVFIPYGKEFQASRRLFQDQLSKKQCTSYHDRIVGHARTMAEKIKGEPSAYEKHIQYFVTSVIADVTYGHQVSGADDQHVHISNFVIEFSDTIGTQGANLLDIFPFLKHLPAWVPGAWFIRYAQGTITIVGMSYVLLTSHFNSETSTEYKKLETACFEEVRREVAADTATPSFVSNHLKNMLEKDDPNIDDILRLKRSGLHFYSAGIETLLTVISTFLFTMLRHPEVQKKAQEEIESVLGKDRLPDFSDRASLPYVEAVLQETMRWHPPSPLAIPHKVTSDDSYRNVFIPKGSTVIANVRSMTLDEKTWHNPREFIPERYLPSPLGQGEPFAKGIFGFGRRACPGKYLAEGTVWIVVVTILAGFDIRPVQDEFGEDVIPPLRFITSITSRPAPFECRLVPRIS
ncbi:hypothetical protein NLI96_g3080 [Meripilus lineatus]|uniref:Cytochrome P450 n=1 Tax=Meripilus lineatus TaxID=2056292 RepID=A0AAD5YLC0_9APHY|nr:hypothetical protein NLI96_g3080 [Physisporinus lineatus]